jgi:hypothetical protein
MTVHPPNKHELPEMVVELAAVSHVSAISKVCERDVIGVGLPEHLNDVDSCLITEEGKASSTFCIAC